MTDFQLQITFFLIIVLGLVIGAIFDIRQDLKDYKEKRYGTFKIIFIVMLHLLSFDTGKSSKYTFIGIGIGFCAAFIFVFVYFFTTQI